LGSHSDVAEGCAIWDVTLCCWSNCSCHFEVITVLWNVKNHSPDNTVSNLRVLESSLLYLFELMEL